METDERIREHFDSDDLDNHPEVVEARSIQNCNQFTIEVRHSIPLRILSKLDADPDLEFRVYPTHKWEGKGKIRLVIRPTNRDYWTRNS